MAKISERTFEEAIEDCLLTDGPAGAPGKTALSVVRDKTDPFASIVPGGYRKRRPEEYDKELCLIPREVLDFVYATQAREWERLKEYRTALVSAAVTGRIDVRDTA